MNKTKIDWCDFTINPVKGYCPVGCPYCYARKLYDRFKWDKTIRYVAYLLPGLAYPVKIPSRIFVGSTMELFGPWVKESWMADILGDVRRFSRHTFIFLTKRPWELLKWNPWPKNCFVGASVTNNRELALVSQHFDHVVAKVKFLSFEPLLERLVCLVPWPADWVIIGAQTQPLKLPSLEWVEEIEKAADRAGIPVFEKSSLTKLLKRPLRQEFPR